MFINKRRVIAGTFVVIAAAAAWIVMPRSDEAIAPTYDERYSWFNSGSFEIGVAVIPDTPQVGANDLIVAVRLPDGSPLTHAEVSAFAEMPAMGSMSAMRTPADLVATTDGQFEGSVNLRMRGAWPLTVSVTDPLHGNAKMTLDLATDRQGLRVSSGGKSIGPADVGQDKDMAADMDMGGPTITIDSRRRQLIGVETEPVTERDLVREIRAVGNVTYDERRLTKVSLRFDAWIGELDADYVGAPITRGQRLFSVYSPELLAAQQEYLEARERLSRRSDDDSLLSAARQRLRLWDLSEREILDLEERGTPLEYVPIYAPASGTVVAKHIDSGSAVKTGDTLLRIADLSQVWIEAELYESELDLIKSGTNATVRLPYLPGQSFAAVVDYVYPYLDKTSRTGRVRLTLENADGVLKPDMYAEVSLSITLGRRLAVPEDAVLFAGDSRVVFVDLGDGRLKPVKIKTGHHVAGLIEVTEGLSPGDVIVTSGNFLIAAETKLKAGIDQW